eukprot:m.223169 g.223169  ORF g.223169 m.223169 type:complete len:130 (+) comp16192_c0_seq1:475-864(+)
MGWDIHHGFQLYQSDPSGNYGGWMATCIGSNAQAAQSILNSDYVEGCTLEQAKALAVRVLLKTMDSTTLSAERLEFATLTRVDGRTRIVVLPGAEVTEMLKTAEEQRKKEEQEEKAKKEAAARKRGADA